MKIYRLVVLLIVLVFIGGNSADANPSGDDYTWEVVADGFDRPLLVTNAGDGSGRLFVIEQAGYILVIDNGELLFTPFLDISLLIPTNVQSAGYSEEGLLGLAFDPNFAENQIFYIYYTNRESDIVLARYQVSADDPNVADPASSVILLTFDHPHENHNGGGIVFGPDGYLYIGVGDGGSGDDPDKFAQNKGVLLGKMLRLDVSDTTSDTYMIPESNPFVGEEGVKEEIWAYGLRNPWRFGFDRVTGDLYIGDVGQGAFEEVDFQPADSAGGENYGWRVFEGSISHFPEDGLHANEAVFPIAEYPHDKGCSVTGGYVYRGETLPELQGYYFYGDYCIGTIWSTIRDENGKWQTEVFMETRMQISSFGEDEVGELYMTNYSGGQVLKLVQK